MKNFWISVALLLLVCAPAPSQVVDYDIVYSRQVRFGDNTNTTWPEFNNSAIIDPGADLMLLHPDGSEEMLYDCTTCSVVDPFPTFDGESVLFAVMWNANPTQRTGGSSIFRISLETRALEELAGPDDWDTPSGNPIPGRKVYNTAPVPVAGNRIMFTSTRAGFIPPKFQTQSDLFQTGGGPNLTFQLYAMNADGSNVEPVAPMSIASALHPTPLNDGRVLFSTNEAQGARDRRLWALWSIYPDGRHWEPILSSFFVNDGVHFVTQLSNQDVVATRYYNLFANGFGIFYRFPLPDAATSPNGAPFQDWKQADNPFIREARGGCPNCGERWPFMPWGIESLTEWTNGGDFTAPKGIGKVTHPSAAPDGQLLAVYTPGPANHSFRSPKIPYYDGGIYVIPDGAPTNGPEEFILVKNDPAYNEAYPRAVVPWSAIHGQPEPTDLGWVPNDGTLDPALPEGTPYGLVGTSSMTWRNTKPTPGSGIYDIDAFNSAANGQSTNWTRQGSDAGWYSDEDIAYVRLLAMEPRIDGAPQDFKSAGAERLRVLGEVPVRHPEAPGDTSWMAKIPADTPFTFQTLDERKMVLNMAQTWHQVRPGEKRVDCGGCHAHARVPEPFEGKVASRPDYVPADLTGPYYTVEFERDIKPILDEKCAWCHVRNGGPGLDLRTPTCLTQDRGGNCQASTLANGNWRQTNVSAWVRPFQSRRSFLIWKIYEERLDGKTNADYPSGAECTNTQYDCDRDYAPGTLDHKAMMTEAERQMFVKWVDLGAAVGSGFLQDTQRPALHVQASDGGVIVSAADPSGPVEVALFENETPVTLSDIGDNRWFANVGGGALSAIATDLSGNQSVRFPVPGECVSTPNNLCLKRGRFHVSLNWDVEDGRSGAGNAGYLSADSGYFTFFNENNVEVLVKVLEDKGRNFWVFAAGLTNLAVDLRVTDTMTGQTATYRNPKGSAFQAITDTGAFRWSEDGDRPSSADPPEIAETQEYGKASVPLLGGRFRVWLEYATETDAGTAEAMALTENIGLFAFRNKANIEVLVKVLRGKDESGEEFFWVFAAGLTNQEIVIHVLDVESGNEAVYRNPAKSPFVPIQDMESFAN